jgi:hypothetical protein
MDFTCSLDRRNKCEVWRRKLLDDEKSQKDKIKASLRETDY